MPPIDASYDVLSVLSGVFKTEVLVFSSRYCPRPNIHDLTVDDEVVNCSSTAKDIGVILFVHGSAHNSSV